MGSLSVVFVEDPLTVERSPPVVVAGSCTGLGTGVLGVRQGASRHKVLGVPRSLLGLPAVALFFTLPTPTTLCRSSCAGPLDGQSATGIGLTSKRSRASFEKRTNRGGQALDHHRSRVGDHDAFMAGRILMASPAAPAVSRYRLTAAGRAITCGPLALVVPQAEALAAQGRPAEISDDHGRRCLIEHSATGVTCTVLPVLEFFPTPETAAAPQWVPRAKTLITNLQTPKETS